MFSDDVAVSVRADGYIPHGGVKNNTKGALVRCQIVYVKSFERNEVLNNIKHVENNIFGREQHRAFDKGGWLETDDVTSVPLEGLREHLRRRVRGRKRRLRPDVAGEVVDYRGRPISFRRGMRMLHQPVVKQETRPRTMPTGLINGISGNELRAKLAELRAPGKQSSFPRLVVGEYTAATSYQVLVQHPIAPCVSCSCADALHAPSSKLPPSSSVCLRLQLVYLVLSKYTPRPPSPARGRFSTSWTMDRPGGRVVLVRKTKGSGRRQRT